jgi:dynein heavy chain 1
MLKDFEEDLRKVLKRAGCKGEKICFIFDESNVLKPSFLEYMNSLLASGEVPGLFEADEYTTLINAIKV